MRRRPRAVYVEAGCRICRWSGRWSALYRRLESGRQVGEMIGRGRARDDARAVGAVAVFRFTKGTKGANE